MNIEATKLELIKLIADEKSEQLLEQVRQFFKQQGKEGKPQQKNGKQAAKTATEESNPMPPSIDGNGADELMKLAMQPTPVSIDLEQLKKEQGYDTAQVGAYFRSLDRSVWKDENKKELLELLRQ